MTARDEILFQIVLGIDVYGMGLRAGESWTRCPNDPRGGNRPAWEFVNNGVAYDPAEWRGEGSLDRESVRELSEALDKLEEEGLLVRIRTGKRTTHLRPTAAGLKAGIAVIRREHGAAAPDLDAVRIGLKQAKWGRPDLLEAAKA